MITRRDFTKLASIAAGNLFVPSDARSQESRTRETGNPVTATSCERSGSAPDLEWSAYGGDTRNTKYSPASQIDASNASRLKVAWRWSSPDNDIAKQHPDLHLNLFEGTPVIHRGALYVATGFHMVASLDAQNGRTRWIYDPGIYRRGIPQRNGFIHRGVAVWTVGDGRILFASGDGYLTALDAASGKPIPTFGRQGQVDLLEALRRPGERFQIGVDSPPVIVRDRVIVGSFVQDGWLTKEATPGDVLAYDVRTGKLCWTFHVVPEGREEGVSTWLLDSWKYSGAANVWTIMSADEELGYVYLPTSTPTNDHYGGHRPGDNLFAESVVRLDASTGRRVWHFQTAHHGLWDYDLPAAPVLADVTIQSRRRKVLAQVSKQAFVYVLDRETGRPIWPIEERAVPKSSVPEERLSPTQPFPSLPAAFDRQGVVLDDLIDFTPELRKEAEQIVYQYDFGTLYTPPSERGTILMPGVVGGASWAGAALDPESGWLYIPSITQPYVIRLKVPAPGTSNMNYRGSERFRLMGPEGLPLTKPPYGRVTAIDLNTGEVKWVVPHGSGPRDHAKLKPLNLPVLGWPSRGFVVLTKTLLFAVQEPATSTTLSDATNTFELTATTREPCLRIFNKHTGDLIQEITLPANAGGAPITYNLGSRQYLVVPVGGGGVRSELVALALHNREGTSGDGN